MDEKNYGVRILSIERLDREAVRWKNHIEEFDHPSTRTYDGYDVDSYNSRLYEIRVDFYGRKEVFNIPCNGWSGDYDGMFKQVIDSLRLMLNCILIDNIDEAKEMFLEANYNVRMSSPRYFFEK